MHPTQSQLFADHHNFLRLLHCLEVELAHYEADEAWTANLPVILDIFDYVQFYPERYHHPIEDAVFDLLIAKDVAESEHARALKAEHKTLEDLTRKARQLFNSVAADNVVPVRELVRVTREFLDRQVQHIKRENQLIYPTLSQHVSPEEWDAISTSVGARRDPLFSRRIIEEYDDLYHAILAAESGVAPGATARAISTDRPAREVRI
ncbi:hemerythrin domain-containing protein [Gilvimarinus sp. F26214L]|uniref:hemerythrin domain-containing protein n=1 Tax=Gilvimarinus sp. DZF01 TaxID=3461371 RepID=UPI004045A3BD